MIPERLRDEQLVVNISMDAFPDLSELVWSGS